MSSPSKANCSLDTNCVLALMLETRVPEKALVEKLLRDKRCYVSSFVLLEVEFVLRSVYDFPRDLIAHNIESLCSYPNIESDVVLIKKALHQYLIKPALSFADLLITYDAAANKMQPLFTFDKKLANQSSGIAKLLA